MTGGCQIAFSSFGVDLALRLPAELAALVDEVLPPGWRPADADRVAGTIDVVPQEDDTLQVRVDGTAVAALHDPALALAVVDSEVRAKIGLLAPDHVFVHAGAVVVAGRAVVLPGGSFAGKTSLVAALVQRGADYLSDEFAVLDRTGLVHPYPRPLSFRRPGSPRNAARSVEELGGAVAAPCRAALVVVTQYVPGARWKARPLSRSETALALLANTVPARTRSEEALEVVAAATVSVRAFESERDEALDAADEILALLSGHRSGLSPSPSRPRVRPSEPHEDLAPPAPVAPIAPSFAVGLRDAAHSGWFGSGGAGELFTGMPIGPDDVVVDVGCGDGGHASYCATHAAEVVVVDVDPAKVAATELRIAPAPARTRGIVGDGTSMPLPDGYASRVIATEVLEHVDDPAAFLAELVRVGRGGARYLLTAPDEVAEGVQRRVAPDVYFQKPNHVRVIGRGELEQLVQDAGLVVEQHSSYGFYWAVWFAMFWTTGVELTTAAEHPLLDSWAKTWAMLLDTPGGLEVKHALDEVMPKSQVIVARKPG